VVRQQCEKAARRVAFWFDLGSLPLVQRRPNASDGHAGLLQDEPSLKPQDAITQAPKHAVPAGVSLLAPSVTAAINFDDQASRRRDEVSDEAPTKRHLPAEGNAEFLAREQPPESGFGRSGKEPHAMSALCEKRVSFW